MKTVKITVIDKELRKELVSEYGVEGFTACKKFEVGQTFTTAYEKPEGFCDEAWKAIQHYVFALAFGADGFWETWMSKRNVSINTCNDGLRPVTFKIESVEDEVE